MSKNNITYIRELENLEDLESGNSHLYNQAHNFTRSSYSNIQNFTPLYQQNQEEKSEYFNPNPNPNPNPNMNTEDYNNLSTPSCLDIHSHITNCPICSRFFRNDNAIYIIAIIILSVICILLLKRVLNL